MATLIDSFDPGNTGLNATLYSGGSGYDAWYQTFTVPALGTILSSAKFWMAKTGSPTGNATFKVYAITGTPGSTATPTGSALATSDPLNVTTLTGTSTLKELFFTGANEVTLTTGTYAITVEYSGGNSTNSVDVYRIVTGGDAGNAGYSLSSSSSWVAQSTLDFAFYVYGNTVPVQIQKTHTVDSYLRLPEPTYSFIFPGGWGAGYAGEQYGGLGSVPYTTQTLELTHTIDAALKNVYTSTHTIDSILAVRYTSIHTIDALLRSSSIITHSVDSVLNSQYTTSVTIDSLLFLSGSISHSIDSLLIAQIPTVNHSVDSLFVLRNSAIHTIDSLLRANDAIGYGINVHNEIPRVGTDRDSVVFDIRRDDPIISVDSSKVNVSTNHESPNIDIPKSGSDLLVYSEKPEINIVNNPTYEQMNQDTPVMGTYNQIPTISSDNDKPSITRDGCI